MCIYFTLHDDDDDKKGELKYTPHNNITCFAMASGFVKFTHTAFVSILSNKVLMGTVIVCTYN